MAWEERMRWRMGPGALLALLLAASPPALANDNDSAYDSPWDDDSMGDDDDLDDDDALDDDDDTLDDDDALDDDDEPDDDDALDDDDQFDHDNGAVTTSPGRPAEALVGDEGAIDSCRCASDRSTSSLALVALMLVFGAGVLLVGRRG